MLWRRCDLKGFSLVEMIAAMAIFGTGVLAMMEVFSMNLHATATSRDYSRAVLLAQGLMEQTLASGELIAGEESGEFAEAFPDATWTCEITDTETIGLYEVRVSVAWPERGKERSFELITLAAER